MSLMDSLISGPIPVVQRLVIAYDTIPRSELTITRNEGHCVFSLHVCHKMNVFALVRVSYIGSLLTSEGSCWSGGSVLARRLLCLNILSALPVY